MTLARILALSLSLCLGGGLKAHGGEEEALARATVVSGLSSNRELAAGTLKMRVFADMIDPETAVLAFGGRGRGEDELLADFGIPNDSNTLEAFLNHVATHLPKEAVRSRAGISEGAHELPFEAAANGALCLPPLVTALLKYINARLKDANVVVRRLELALS